MVELPEDEAGGVPPRPSSGAEEERPAQAIDAWAARAVQLGIESVEIKATLRRPLRLQEPLNAAVRGLFGARLRDLRCLTRAPTCAGCAETERCDYARIFETAAALTPGAHGSHGTHPFWLRGVPAIQDVAAGTQVLARLSVVGFARPALPYLDVSLRDAWTRLGPGAVALSGSRVVREAVVTTRWAADAVRLVAVTPLMLGGDVVRAREDCPAAPWLALLVRAGVRRVTSLLMGYLPEAPPARVVFPDLRGVQVVEGGWSVWRGSRYSARQGQRVPLAGWVGSAVVRGAVLEALAPLLGVLGAVSVGKGTTMGFGEIRVEPVMNDGGSSENAEPAMGGGLI